MQIQEVEPIYFRGQAFRARKHFRAGTHRVRDPEETLRLIQPLFKKIGLTRLGVITGLDRIGIDVVVSVRPNANLLAVDAGKGFTLTAAKVSAAMESIERYHDDVIELETTFATYEEISKQFKTIPVDRLSTTHSSFFRTQRLESWVKGWDIMNEEEVAFPQTMATTRSLNGMVSMGAFMVGTNGLASGNVFLEALCAAMYEAIERDGIACHQFAENENPGSTMRKIRLESIQYPMVRELLQRFEEVGIGVSIFDCITDVGVPIYVARIWDNVVRNIGIYKGYGAHLDPEIAMIRALTEAVQARLVYISGSRDDFFHQEYLALKIFDNPGVIEELNGRYMEVDCAARQGSSTDTFEGDVGILLKRLKQAGLDQVIALDITLPGFEDISVVRVVIPGLEGYRFSHYQPGYRAKAFSKRMAQV